jgi:cephalosporin hydroxylase
MQFFAGTLTKPYIAESGYRDLCEVGASLGLNTDKMLELGPVRMTLIDPCVDAQLTTKYAGEPRVVFHKGLSLEVLPVMEQTFDAFLLDGDHNWYTTYNELRLIHERKLLRAGGTIFLHDVNWPYERRDLYYDPDRIPAEFRHPYAKKGMVRGQSELAETGGASSHLYNARHEGGPRNGVFTAIEDFLKEHPGEYEFFRVNRENGLGVLRKKGGSSEGARAFARYKAKAKRINWIEDIKDFLKPSRRGRYTPSRV